jgi:hypothetical protein
MAAPFETLPPQSGCEIAASGAAQSPADHSPGARRKPPNEVGSQLCVLFTPDPEHSGAMLHAVDRSQAKERKEHCEHLVQELG